MATSCHCAPGCHPACIRFAVCCCGVAQLLASFLHPLLLLCSASFIPAKLSEMVKASKQAVPGCAGEVCGSPEVRVDTACVPVPPCRARLLRGTHAGSLFFKQVVLSELQVSTRWAEMMKEASA